MRLFIQNLDISAFFAKMPVVDSFRYLVKPIQYCKVKKKKKRNRNETKAFIT